MRTEVHRLEGVNERFLLEVRDFPRTLDDRQRDLAERAARALRFGFEERQPGVARLVQQLARELSLIPSLVSRDVPEESAGTSALSPFERSLPYFIDEIADALLSGRIGVFLDEAISLTERREGPIPKLPPLPPPKPQGPDTFFDVRFVDEIGQAIPGIDADFSADGPQTRPTNAAGVALLEGVQVTSASVAVLDPEALAEILDPRWEKFRPGKAPKASNTREVTFRGAALGPFPLKAALPHTIVVKPPLGKLFVELWDKTGRVRHADRVFKITGPQDFEGTTDEQGRLLQEDVFPGDYSLSLALELSEEGAPVFVDLIDGPLVVLDPAATSPQVRFVGAARRVIMARLRRMFFETNKSFLLPGAVGAFQRIRELYDANNPSELLIVGHTDTTAEPAINDPLSLERADMTAAYLSDDVQAWLSQYELAIPLTRRWGAHEDELMLSAMPDFGTKPSDEDDVRWFQRTRGLSVDGIAGPKTRRELIHEYMALDGTSLRERRNYDITITTHGCGENFPLDDEGEELDTAPEASKEDASDRRVELFFFDAEFGIQPPPPAKNSAKGSTEYPLWRKKVTQLVELDSSFIEGLIVEWRAELDEFVPDDLVLEATQGEKTQRLAWTDGFIDGPFRRFIFRKILGPTPVTLVARSELLSVELSLWREQNASSPDAPPTWEHFLEEILSAQAEQEDEDEGSAEAGAELPATSDATVRPSAAGEFA